MIERHFEPKGKKERGKRKKKRQGLLGPQKEGRRTGNTVTGGTFPSGPSG